MSVRAGLLACLVLLVSATPAAAQQDRARLIQEARISADEAERRNLFVEAANPAVMDSLWAVSVYEIAQIMRDLGQDDVAETWLRWVVRHGQWPIDRGYFSPSLLTFYDAIADSVSQDPGAGAALTEWSWPDAFSESDAGTLEVATSDPALALTVIVEGQELQPGASLTLPAGTYDLVASGVDYESMQVQREVLPGVETVVAFEMVPLLPDAAMQQVGRSLVSLSYAGAGATVCGNGLTVRDGYVVTSLTALGGATDVEVLQADGSALAASIVERDSAGDIAVLSVPNLGRPPLAPAQLAGPGFGWSVFRSGCDAPLEDFRTRLSGTGQAGAPIPLGALGSPLVDRSGSVMGLVATGGLISPIARVEQLVEAADAQLVEAGGFPVVLVVAAVAAVGGLAGLLLGGGGDSGPDPGPGPGPGTGTIVITIPSG